MYVQRQWILRRNGHDILIYTVQISRRPRTLPHQPLWNEGQTAWEALVDGEWASPSGHRFYQSYEDALAAAMDAVSETSS